MRWEGYVAHSREAVNTYRIVGEKMSIKVVIWESVCGKIILKWIFKK